MSVPRILVALFCIAPSWGCTYWQKNWREIDAGPVLFEDVWNTVVRVAEVDGYPLYPGGTDRGMKILETRWRGRAAPFKGGSQRQRLHAEFQRSDNQRNWIIRFYVERQTVSDMRPGFDPKEEDWEHDGQDGQTEERFGYKLRERFGGLPKAPDRPKFDRDGQ